ELVESINCPKCGGPLNLTTGEVIVTCPYCGTASRIRGDKPFVLTHSMLAARMDRDGALRAIQGWMEGGVMKPDDLRKASRITSLERGYLPFYVFEVAATAAPARGRRRPSAGIVEGSRGRHRRCAHAGRREGLRVPPRPDLVLDLRVPDAVVHDLARWGVRGGRARGHPASERRLRRVLERRGPRHVSRLTRLIPPTARGSRSPRGTRRSSGTSRRPGRSPTRTRGNESSGGPGSIRTSGV